MVELSLNVLDIAQNGIKAGATTIDITVKTISPKAEMTISVADNGCGMTEEQLAQVVDPFYTTRTTRKVGLGVPFFKMSAEMTGGSFAIDSAVGVGTTTTAIYQMDSIDMMPLGDMAATMIALISVNDQLEFTYTYGVDDNQFTLDTRELRLALEGIPLSSPKILSWIGDFIRENTLEITSKG